MSNAKPGGNAPPVSAASNASGAPHIDIGTASLMWGEAFPHPLFSGDIPPVWAIQSTRASSPDRRGADGRDREIRGLCRNSVPQAVALPYRQEHPEP